MSLITAQQVADQQFETSRWGRWYDADQVDQFLDQVKYTIHQYEQLQQCEQLTSKLADAILARMSQKIAGMHTDGCRCHDKNEAETA